MSIPKIIEEKTNNTIIARQGSDLIMNFSPMVRLSLDTRIYLSYFNLPLIGLIQDLYI